MIDNTIDTEVTMRDAASVGGAKRFRPGDEILGRYVVESELGQGGMGVVYLCLDKVGGVKVAVKGLPPEVSHNSDEMVSVRENFQLVSELQHPNIAGVRTLEKDAGTGDYYLVMTFARGVSLKQWIRQHGGKEHRAEQLNVLRQIASALDYAHNAEPRHIIHRDIKPENVMVDGHGNVSVLDFGLAAQVRSSLSRVSQVVTSRSGTPAYKSPEQWLAQAQRAPSDQYSLGVIAYQMFAGELPYDSDDIEILKHAVVFDPVPSIPDEGKAVNAVFAKVLAKKPEERFASCGDFVAALERKNVAKIEGMRSRVPAIVVLVTALALAVGGWWWLERVKSEELRVKNEAIAAEQARKAGDTKTITLPGGAKMEMAWCPLDSFMMGSPTSDDPRDTDETQHRVTLTQGFWMGAKEVTQGQWKSVMGTTIIDQARKALHDDTKYGDTKYGGKTVREWLDTEKYDDPATVCGDIDEEVAMYYVSWEEASEFCEKLTERERAAGRLPDGWRYCLPTEAQWEYACRAGTDSPLPNGKQLKVLGQNNAPALDDIAWYGGNSSVGFAGRGWDTAGWTEKQYPGGRAGPRKGGLKRKNRFGLYDIIGNVWEWCADWYGDYPVGAVSDPTGPASGAARVVRGGSWNRYARHCRSADRSWFGSGFCFNNLGFRLVCSLPIAAASQR